MKKIYIKEEKFSLLNLINEDKQREVTFYEFFMNAKAFLKDLLNKPEKAKPSELFDTYNISKNELLNKMSDLGLIKSDEKIIEVPVEEEKTHPFGKKMVSKHIVKYKIPKSHFEEKMHELYKELFEKKSLVKEDGEGGMGGATSCGGVMQGGGSNPSAGQYEAPLGPVQRRKFFEPTLTRNKDEKNGSISMNRQK